MSQLRQVLLRKNASKRILHMILVFQPRSDSAVVYAVEELQAQVDALTAELVRARGGRRWRRARARL